MTENTLISPQYLLIFSYLTASYGPLVGWVGKSILVGCDHPSKRPKWKMKRQSIGDQELLWGGGPRGSEREPRETGGEQGAGTG